jgi:hypothetical protein
MLAQQVVDEFRVQLRGELIEPNDPTYDEARKVYNGMIDKRPALIARCVDVADVIRSVKFGRDNHLTVAVRGVGQYAGGPIIENLIRGFSRQGHRVVENVRYRIRVFSRKHGPVTNGGEVVRHDIYGLVPQAAKFVGRQFRIPPIGHQITRNLHLSLWFIHRYHSCLGWIF